MTDQQSRDFDADTITGVQDYSDFTIVSVDQTTYGHDIEVVVSYGMTSKDEHGKSYPLIKVGYIVKQNAAGDWKVDDVMYADDTTHDLSQSFRVMTTPQH